MRRIKTLFFFLLCMAAQVIGAQPLTQPVPGQAYTIVHSSGFLMSSDADNKLKIMDPGVVEGQKFEFLPVEGVEGAYHIKLIATGKYLMPNGYNAVWSEDVTDEKTQWNIVLSHDPVYVNLQNVSIGKCLGTDSNSSGSGVYTDKNGKDGKHCWYLSEASEGAITTALENALAEAEALMADVSVGTDIGQYPQEAVDALNAVIATAKGLLTSNDQTAINEAVVTLNEAMSTFKLAQITLIVDPDKYYYFMHAASDLVLAVNENSAAIIQFLTGAEQQKFKLVAVEGINNVYNFQLFDGTGYITRVGGWDTTVGTDPTVDEARFVVELVDATTGAVRFNRYKGYGYFGTDSNDDSSLVYTNKGGNVDRSWWTLLEVVEGQLIFISLEKTIAKAEAILAKAVPGNQPGEYPQAAVDAFTQAIESAKAALNATAQTDINAAVMALNEAISVFQDAENDPVFVPAAGVKYRFAVNKYNAKYMTATAEGKIGTADYTAGDANQHWEFVKAEGEEGAYIVKNGDKALNYDFTLTDFDAVASPRWIMPYTVTANHIDCFALVEADDPTKVLTFGQGTQPTLQEFDLTNSAHQGRFTRVDLPNDPNLTNLENAIASARYTLKNIDRGNQVGQWNDAKCEAFEAVIVKAETLTGADQETVDAMVQELRDAETNFKNNPNSVIKDELEAQLAAAKDKLANAVVGIEAGQFFQSDLDEMETTITDYEKKANEVSEQEACDQLTSELTAIVEAFTGHETQQTVKAVLDDAITSAEALYEREKDNVGTDKGQRPQEVIDAFKDAIDRAKTRAAADPVISDLTELQNARAAFLNGAVSVDRKALKEAIAAAGADGFKNLVAGEFDGNYPQDKIDAFNTALAAAQEALTDMSFTQEQVNECTKALNDAMKALKDAQVKIDFAALDASIALAEPLYASVTVIGDGEGQCPQSAVDAFKAVIDEAKAIDRKAIKQADVDALVGKLDQAAADFKTTLVASTGLQNAIDAAVNLLDETAEGMKPGNYPSTARKQLSAAIEAAKAAMAAEDATQASLLAQVEALKAAVEKYKGAIVPPHDLTELNAVIAEVESFIAEHGNEFTALNIALDKAKAIAAAPDNYTKSEVSTALTNLKKALEYAKQMSGIETAGATSFGIYVENGLLSIDGLQSRTQIAVYTLNGGLVLSVETSEAGYTTSLARGSYVVAVRNGQVKENRVIIIK